MRTLPRILIGLGLVLLVVAPAAFLASRPAPSSGDVAAIESALAPATTGLAATPSSTLPPSETTTLAPVTTTPIAVAPGVRSDGELPSSRTVVPVGLRIDDLDVAAPVAGYGVDAATGDMAVPDDVSEVGWYEFGAAPGDAGSAVLAAHVDTASQGRGVFFDLRTLEPGAEVEVAMSDDSVRRFRVVARQTYLKDDLPLDAIFSRRGPAVLTLITCGGGFNRGVGSYDSNVVVYAEPIDTALDAAADSGGL